MASVETSRPAIRLRDYQITDLDSIRAGFRGHRSVLLVQPTGCHAAGQGILRFSGDVAPVEELKVGDLLMGTDSQPRRILNLVRGFGQMWKVTPTKGKPFVVNHDHVLTLVRTNDGSSLEGRIIDIPVRGYMRESNGFRHIYKLFREPAAFPAPVEGITIDPYILGVILGDGGISLGILGRDCGSKFIPRQYKIGSFECRLSRARWPHGHRRKPFEWRI